jgi:hypothetical protein
MPKQMLLRSRPRSHKRTWVEAVFPCALAMRRYRHNKGTLLRAILLLKYERIEPLGVWFAERLAEVVRSERERMEADVI